MQNIEIKYYEPTNIDSIISMSSISLNGAITIPYSDTYSPTNMFATKIDGIVHCFEQKLPYSNKCKVLVYDRRDDCLRLIVAEQFNEKYLFLGTLAISFANVTMYDCN